MISLFGAGRWHMVYKQGRLSSKGRACHWSIAMEEADSNYCRRRPLQKNGSATVQIFVGTDGQFCSAQTS